ncbi:MAG TPA: TIGR03118 family protein, partial [Gemmataceae bacterium]|nr:TIGR03118 family protein [Gemmataceae bacterium]
VSGFSGTGQAATASPVFLFATEDGTIVGWSPNVNPTGFDAAKAGTYAILAVDNSGNNLTEPNEKKQTGAVYKGLAIATSPTAGTPIFTSDPNSTSVLYAANFRSGQVEVYGRNFQPVTLAAGAFRDRTLPGDYAPFNVQVLGGKVYVTYAKQDANKKDDVAGHNHGFVDVFNLDGSPAGPSGSPRLITRDHLDSPWGVAIAPASFGSLAGDLLVGNFGSGRIDAFDSTGHFQGQLVDPDGEPIEIDGLWALQVGNGQRGGDANSVYFTAGLFDESHGLFGSLTPVAAGTDEGDAEQQMVTAALDVFNLAVDAFQHDLTSGASRDQLRQDLRAVVTAFHDYLRAAADLAADQQDDQGGGGGRSSSFQIPSLGDLFADLGRRDQD